jgi:hypothetical protein
MMIVTIFLLVCFAFSAWIAKSPCVIAGGISPALIVAMFSLSIPVTAFADDDGSKLVTTPIIDGMTIQTADVAANVKVRAKSLGPGKCAVKISDDKGDESDILAPLTDWSDWHTLVANIGQVSLVISVNVVCATGVVAEVQYYGPK